MGWCDMGAVAQAALARRRLRVGAAAFLILEELRFVLPPSCGGGGFR